MTLVEIIVSIAIIGMLVIGISGMLDLSVKQIFDSGSRTREIMVVQEVVDLLQERNNSKTAGMQFNDITEIQAFLNPYKTAPKYMIDYQIDTKAKGWTVTISKVHNKGGGSVQLSTYVANY